MKRRDLVRHLEPHGCPLKRNGGIHSIIWNLRIGRREPVPTHSEIPDLLARKICRSLAIPPP